MERDLTLHIEINSSGDYKVVSDEPESGTTFLVDAGNIFRQDDDKFHKKIGQEVMSWITMWSDELEESEDDEEC